jgi:hypothetical protein
MSLWWSLKEKTTPNPLSFHQAKVDAAFMEWFPESTLVSTGIIARLRQFLAFMSQQLEASSIQSFNDLKENVLLNSFPNEKWWGEKMKEFQMGDELVVSKGNIAYTTINPAKQIIKYVSVRTDRTSSFLDLIIKYGKDRFATVTTDEAVAIAKYVQLIKIAGIRLRVQPAQADNIKLTIQVNEYVGQQVTNLPIPLNEGLGIPFGNILNNHFQQLPFDGVFTLADAEQALSDAFANKYVRITSAEWKPSSSGVYVAFQNTIASEGGYFSVDLANSNVIFK